MIRTWHPPLYPLLILEPLQHQGGEISHFLLTTGLKTEKGNFFQTRDT